MSTPSPDCRAGTNTPTKRFIFAVVVGIVAAVAYFSYTLTFSLRARGIYFGDSADYINCSLGGLAKVWNHSSYRLFGYPFLLAIFRVLFPGPETFLLPVFWLQVCSYLASALFLLTCLKRTEIQTPWWLPAMVLAHPALVAMSTIPMTDTLTASLFSVALGLMILVERSRTHLWVKAASLGLVMGVGCTFRPAIIPIAALTPFVVAATVFLSCRQEGKKTNGGARYALIIVLSYYSIFAPIYAKLRMNCYNAHNEQCVVPSRILEPEMNVSFKYAVDYSRWEVFFTPDEVGVPKGAPTIDRMFSIDSCSFTAGEPTQQLLNCYADNIFKVPLYLLRRVIGVFDHRHLTIYGLNYTEPWVFVVNRIFSVLGFVGLFSTALLFCKGLWERRLRAFLGIPLLYVAIQINFHPEPRYMFLVTPLFLCVAVSCILFPPFERRSIRRAVWLGAVCLAGIFFYVTHQWDVTFLETYKYK